MSNTPNGYFGEEREPMLDLDALEAAHAAEAFQANEDDDTQACGSGYLDFDLLEAAFAADEGQPVLFRCTVCKINPVDALRGFDTCGWCLSRQ